MSTYTRPGVYHEEVIIQTAAPLPTGVPGFAGFAVPGREIKLQNPIPIRRKKEFETQIAGSLPSSNYLADAIDGFFDNGGGYCYVVLADGSPAESDKRADELIAAIKSLATVDDLDLIAVPDANSNTSPNAITLSPLDTLKVQNNVLDHCATQKNCFAILDSIAGGTNLDSNASGSINPEDNVVIQKQLLIANRIGPINGALYYPWIKIASGRIVPPCGHIAGIYARSDAAIGVFKAPANEEVRGAIDLEFVVENKIQEQLNPQGVNCIRAFPGRGIRVWGARTLSGDLTWRYINVRRLVLTLGRWLNSNMNWATFEPNTPLLWIRIQRELTVHLEQLWQSGALKGDIPSQAFYVKCDAETNPVEEREMGNVSTEIGLAPVSPAEFIIIRIVLRAGTTEIE